MDGKSLDIAKDKLEQLKSILPEVFTEGKLDLEKLRLALGEDINIQDERYVLNWAGKSDAFRALQTPTTATLTPVRDESISFDTTENIFIEGENLEVLKILQKSYYGKIKMIYIDPPYNTGNDSFVYPDKFSESREEYLKRIQAKDEDGFLMKEDLFRRNSRDSGHYHSNWLSMMYPRLFLARNLLRDDGVIFVSIDDNEVHNLRLLMNDVFGEDNFVANIVWQKKYAVSSDDPGIAPMHDHILVYRKTDAFERNLLPRTEKQLQRYKNLDNDSRGLWSSDNYVSNKSRYERPTLWYPIKHPKTNEDVWPDENAVWRYSKEKHQQLEAENRLYWGPDQSYQKPRIKRFLSEIQDGVVPSTWWIFKDVGHNDEGQKETALLLGKKVFSTPKPVRLMKRIIEIGTNRDDLILDFFAGSGTLGQAILESNLEDQGKRKFLLVQLPELTDQKEYTSIAEIGKERIRRVIQKLKEENPMFGEQGLDLGFKVYKLKLSNFKLWRGDGIDSGEVLEKQLDMLADPVREETLEENMLYELLLKSGYALTANLEKREIGKTHYYLADGELVIALNSLDEALVQDVLAKKPQRFICLDRLFANNDQLKTNTQLQFKDAGISFHSI